MSMLTIEHMDDLVTSSEAAREIGVGLSTISNWVARGYLKPSGLNESNRPMYKLIDIIRVARDTRRRAIGRQRTA